MKQDHLKKEKQIEYTDTLDEIIIPENIAC